jgi:hypothetical protein
VGREEIFLTVEKVLTSTTNLCWQRWKKSNLETIVFSLVQLECRDLHYLGLRARIGYVIEKQATLSHSARGEKTSRAMIAKTNFGIICISGPSIACPVLLQ